MAWYDDASNMISLPNPFGGPNPGPIGVPQTDPIQNLLNKAGSYFGAKDPIHAMNKSLAGKPPPDTAAIAAKYPTPQRPDFYSPVDANGNLKSNLKMNAPDKVSFGGTTFTPSEQGVAGKALTEAATRVGPSPWLTLQLQGINADKQRMLDEMRGENASGTATARSALAMRGGITSGARERIGTSGMRDQMRNAQGIMGDSQRAALQSQMFDEAQKQDLLSKATGFENDLSKFNATGNFDMSKANALGNYGADTFNANNQMDTNKFNINNALSGMGSMNANNLDIYKENMKGRSSNIMADTVAQSGKK